MAAKKVGDLIREARTNAGLTQEALAKKIKTLSANDISKAERGEKELTQEELKAIAKITGVTQKSLLEAAKGKKTTTTSKPASSTAKKTSGTSVTLTATEKRLVELYRSADAETKKAAMSLLKGETQETNSVVGNLLNGLLNSLRVSE
ncbi:MAG: helix-turn-helix domain-containing protein [Acetatifactor sp.]|nr:helix-turn-helix domain-containing protein [Acetatifactor sp.]